MILTTNARYAIIATIEIATNQYFALSTTTEDNKKKPPRLKLADIAKNNQIPLSCLEQIFSKLKNAQIVRAIKGPGGGYVFDKALKEISLASILIAVGEKMKNNSCHSVNNCTKDFINRLKQDSRCKTQHLWQALESQIYNYFASISLEDICSNPQILGNNQHFLNHQPQANC